MIWDILEEETGARLTHSLRSHRRHGEAADATTSRSMCRAAVPSRSSSIVEEGEKLLLKNRIFLDRLENVGVDQRRRRDRARLDGPVPARRPASPTTSARRTRTSSTTRSTSTSRSARRGDTLDRFMVRLGEIRQCARIIEQCARAHGRRRARSTSTTRASSCRRKKDVYTTIEGTIQHFKIVMEGAEGPGRRGVLVHRGRQRRARLLPRLATAAARRIACASARRASSITGGLERVITGRMMADVVPTLRLAQHDRRRV